MTKQETSKIINGRPRECHNKKAQPIPSTKRKRNLHETETTKLHVNNSRKNYKITNCQNTKRTCGQPSGQLFSKKWLLSKLNRTINHMYTCKPKCQINADTKNRQMRITTEILSSFSYLSEARGTT